MSVARKITESLEERVVRLERELEAANAACALFSRPERPLAAAHIDEDAIRAREERLSLLIEATQVGTWDWDPVADVATWNEHAYAMFGLRPEEAPASFATAAKRIHPEDLQAVRLALVKHLERREPFGIDLRAQRADGAYRWVHVNARALRDENGRTQRVIGLILDIHERKAAEVGALDEAARRARELELARQELEEFCYAVSHDLRTPLRSIHGFSRALESEYGPKLDEIGVDYLRRVQRASVNLADLLDSLLGMVRISRVEVHEEEVDLSALAQSVAQDFFEANPEHAVKFSVQPGLRAKGDPRLLRLMMTNLLSNAWKFTSSTPGATVEVGRREGAFFVRDNGAGFDMRYSDKLYKPFQKLHSSARFPGTGIGLTIAHRILARHGGSLWAESKEGEGATFYFRL